MASVPTFGNWENDGVPYTQYFERARKGKGGVKATPEEGNDSISSDAPPVQASPARTKASLNPAQAADPYEIEPRKTVGWDAGKAPRGSESTAHKMGTRPDRSVENSPLNQHTPGRFAGKAGSASPYQSKVPSERSHDVAPTTPGRSRLQQRDEIPKQAASVPKFGDWDEADPAGGAGFTAVFNRVKDERNNPPKRDPYLIKEPEYSSCPPPKANSGSWFSCFVWK